MRFRFGFRARAALHGRVPDTEISRQRREDAKRAGELGLLGTHFDAYATQDSELWSDCGMN